jgi:molybdopterin synthase catalytic subunit
VIRIQSQDFNLAEEYAELRKQSGTTGAIVTFTGLVRDFDEGKGKHLFLEHFPGMTEKVLMDITQQAKQRWPIIDIRIIHRIGQLKIDDQIVFVGVSSTHRKAAFQTCEFIMDYLKTQAPFWKKATSEKSSYWVEAKHSDTEAQERWEK